MPSDTSLPSDTAAPPVDTSTPVPAPSVVLKTSGNGSKNTAQFTTSSYWTMSYTFDCSNFGQQGNFIIYVDYPSGDVAASAYAMSGHDTTSETAEGTHTLKVDTECNWTLTVMDGG